MELITSKRSHIFEQACKLMLVIITYLYSNFIVISPLLTIQYPTLLCSLFTKFCLFLFLRFL